MTDLRLSIEETQDDITGTPPTVSKDDLSQPPVLISEQEVMLGTAAAVRPRSTQITRRMINALHVVGAALQPPPPRPTTLVAPITSSAPPCHEKWTGYELP